MKKFRCIQTKLANKFFGDYITRLEITTKYGFQRFCMKHPRGIGVHWQLSHAASKFASSNRVLCLRRYITVDSAVTTSLRPNFSKHACQRGRASKAIAKIFAVTVASAQNVSSTSQKMACIAPAAIDAAHGRCLGATMAMVLFAKFFFHFSIADTTEIMPLPTKAKSKSCIVNISLKYKG